MSCHGAITLRGAGANNLRIFLLRVPTGRFVVVSGVSGSGKSSLAFATLHAEGMRRYVSSLSVFARQFMRLPARMSHTAATQTFDNPAIAGGVTVSACMGAAKVRMPERRRTRDGFMGMFFC